MIDEKAVEDLWNEWDDKNKRSMTLQPIHFDWMDALETITELLKIARCAEKVRKLRRDGFGGFVLEDAEAKLDEALKPVAGEGESK